MGGAGYSSRERRAIEFARGVLEPRAMPDGGAASALFGMEDDLRAAAASVAVRVNELLTAVDATQFRTHVHPRRIQAEVPGQTGLGVVAWMGTVMGGGIDGTAQTAERLIDSFAKWHILESAARMARRSSSDEEIVPDSVTHGEWIRRLFSTQTRMTLFSEIIVEGGVRGACGIRADERSPRSRKIQRAVGKFYSEIRFFFTDRNRYFTPSACLDIRSVAGAPTAEMRIFRELVAQCSIAEAALAGKEFSAVLSGRGPESSPLIELDHSGSGRYWPAHLDTLLFRPEVALFEAIRMLGLHRGEAFEHAVRFVLGSTLPNDLEVVANSATFNPKLRADELETDLVITHGDQVVMLGDDKCAAPTNSPSPNSMSRDDLGKGIAQVRKRLRALAGGSSMITAEGTALAGHPRCRGIVVTLHGHGGKLWSRDSLAQIDGSPDIVMTSLHSLAFATSMMTSCDDLDEYLSFREDALGRGIEFNDEHELLLGYITGASTPLSVPEERGDRKIGMVIKPYTLPFADSVLCERLPPRAARKEWLRAQSIPVI